MPIIGNNPTFIKTLTTYSKRIIITTGNNIFLSTFKLHIKTKSKLYTNKNIPAPIIPILAIKLVISVKKSINDCLDCVI